MKLFNKSLYMGSLPIISTNFNTFWVLSVMASIDDSKSSDVGSNPTEPANFKTYILRLVS